MYGVNNTNHLPFNYGKKSQPPAPPEQQKPVEEKNTGRKDEILFSSVSRKDESYLSSLSSEAKEYLSKLKEMYPDYDFIVADYETDEEASSLLSKGTGSINVLITPDLLEQMATDEAVRAKYEDVIAGAADQFEEINANLTDGAKSLIKSLGISIDADGNVNFFASLFGNDREDGDKTIKSSLVEDFTNMLNAMAQARAKQLEKQKADNDDKPPQPDRNDSHPKQPDPHLGKSELNPAKGVDAALERLKKHGNLERLAPQKSEPKLGKKDAKDSVLPPKSFEKYKKEENFYDRKKEPGNLPPGSFEKLQNGKNPFDINEKPEKHPLENEEMNFKV